MKLKRLIPLLAGLALLVTGCYKDDIIALQKQIDEMSAFDLDRQVKEIEATIKMLQDSDFQKGIDAVSTALSEKETALQNQINDLKSQVSTAASSTKVEELEAQIVGLTSQLAQVQSSIKVLEGVDLPQTVADLKTLIEKASGYDTEIATLKNQFAGLDLDKKLADIKAAYETAIATSKEEMESYFNSNFQKKFEELFSKTQETIEHWITNSESFQDLIGDFADLQDEVNSQISVLGLRGKEIDSLKNMASAVEYDIKKAIENAINTLQVGDIKALKDSTESLKNAVSTLRSHVDALQELPGKIGDFNKLQTTLVDAIVALQEANKVDDQTLKDLVLALKGCLLDANNELISVKDLISDISANSAQIATNRDSIFINAEAIKVINATINTLPDTDVTDGLAARIAAIESGVIGEKYNLADIVKNITDITTALSSDNGLIAVKEIVAQLKELETSMGTQGVEDDKTVFGLIAGLDAKLALFDTNLKDYVDAESTANKKALADSLDKVNTVLSGLDARIAAIEGKDISSLIERVDALEKLVGEEELTTVKQTLTGAINELVERLNDVDGNAETSLKNLIVALQADLLTIEGGEEHQVAISTTNLYTLNNLITELGNKLDQYESLNFGSKKGKAALDSVIVAVGKIQTTIADELVTSESLTTTLDSYLSKSEAEGLYQTITKFKEIIGEGDSPVAGTVLARIAILEAATVTLTEGGQGLSYADAIMEVFGDLKAHKESYHVTKDEIDKIEGDITAINALLKSDGQELTGFEAGTTVIGALNELKAGLGGIASSYLGTGALDSLARIKDVTELQTSVEAAHQALINAMLGVENGGTAADAGALVQELKTKLNDLTADLWKFNIGGQGELTIQQAVDSLNNRISSVNNAVEALIGTGFEGKTITEYITELEGTLNSLSSTTTNALDTVKANIRGELANVQVAIINGILGVEGGLDALKALNLASLDKRVSDIESAYASKTDLEDAINDINTDLGFCFTKKQADSLVNVIINALYVGDSQADKDTSWNDVTTVLLSFKTQIASALAEIGDATTEGTILKKIADMQTAIAGLQTAIGVAKDPEKGTEASGIYKYIDDQISDIKTEIGQLATKQELAEAISTISGSLGGLYTNAQIDSMVSKIIDAFYLENTPYTDRLAALGSIKTMIQGFKSDIVKALVSIGDTTKVGSNLSVALAALQTTMSTLGETVGDDSQGLVKAVADINSTLEGLDGIPGRVETLENTVAGINATLEGVLTQKDVDSTVLALAKALYVGEKVNDTTVALVHSMMESFKSATEKIGDGFEGITLTTKISDLSSDLASLKEVVGNAKSSDKAATGLFKYVDDAIAKIANEAIQSAIDEALEGVYDKDDIDEIVSNLQTAIDNLNEILEGKADAEGLKQQVATLREEMNSLTEIVQSIVYVPQFEDGMIYVDGVYNEEHPQKYDNPHNNVELDFRINTYRGYKFNPENYTFTGYITSTKIPTKAYAKGGDGFPMKVLSYGGEEGAYKHILALQFNSKEIADNDPFWSGNAGASIAVEIMETNGNSLTTEYIPLKLNRTTEVPSDPGDDPEEPQGVKFVVSPTEQTVGNAGGQIEVKITSAQYWILEGITDDPGIFYFGSAYGGISATIGGSQYSRPFFTGTQIVYFNIPAYTNTRATANGKLPGEALEYTFTFNEYDSNSLDRFNNPNGNNTGTATLTIKQTPRKTQEFETDPAECKNGITVEWNETDTTFFVMPSDQKSDFILNPSPVDWVTFDRDDTGEAGVAEITLNFTERPKTKEGYYGERETTLTLTAATGENKNITIKQLPHPEAEFTFYEGESGDTEVDENTAHTFAYGDYDDVNPFKFRVVPGDGLSDWTYDGDSSFDEKFDVSVSSKDGDGIATVTVSPKAYNADYDNDVTGSITFTLADDETTETLNFVQSKRVASALNVAPDDISFTWDGKKTGETSKDTVHVSVTAEDGFNDWVVKSKPSWVEEITNNGDGIAVIKLNADNNDAEPRTEAVTFCINSEDATYDQDLNITQTARPEDEAPILTITSEDSDFDNGKSFNWNASELEKSVTFTATSGFSGDVDLADKSEGFDEWFTVTPEPTPRTKAAPKASTYTVTPKKVNNDWENDVEKTLTFVSVDKNGVESEEKTVLTFTIKARGSVDGDGAAPTITLNPAATDTTFTCKGYVKKSNNVSVYEFTVAPGTFTEDSWTYDKDETFSTYFELDSTDNASSRTYKVSVKTPLDDAEHIGKLTFTPTAGEESGDPVVMTFKKEAYTQNLTFTENGKIITSGADLSTLKWKTASDNKIVIKVTADNADASHPYTAAITTGGDDFTITPDSSTSESETTFTITPKSDNEDGEDRAGVVTFTSAIGDQTYTFNLKQEYYKQTLSFGKQTVYSKTPNPSPISTYPDTDEPATLEFTTSKSEFRGYGMSSGAATSWTNIVAITVTPPTGDTKKWKAEITGSDFVFSTTTDGSYFSSPTTYSSLNNGEGASGPLTLYVHAKNANTGVEKTGTLKITSASDIEYTFNLSQAKYEQTLTLTKKTSPNDKGSGISDNATIEFAGTASAFTGYSTSNPYTATGWSNIIAISVDPSDDDYNWTVTVSDGFEFSTTSNYTRSGYSKPYTYTPPTTMSSWENKGDGTVYIHANLTFASKTGTITFTSKSGETKTINLVQSAIALKDILDYTEKTGDTNSGSTITVPALGSGYTVSVGYTTSSAFDNLNAYIGKTSTKSADLSQERTITVGGTRKSGNNTGSSTITVTLTLPDKSTTKAEFTYSYTRYGSTNYSFTAK